MNGLYNSPSGLRASRATLVCCFSPEAQVLLSSAADRSIVETKASSILQFLHGLRGELHVTWEEGTWAAWLYDRMSNERLMYSVGIGPPEEKSALCS